MKKPESFLKEYARNLSDDHLYHLNTRFTQNLCGDRSEIAAIMQNHHTIDRWLCSASTCEEWFEMIDMIGDFVKQEVERRSGEREREKSKYRHANKEVIEV